MLSPMECFAGSDLRRACTLRFTPDAVSGRAMMENQAYMTAWAAPRRGILAFDWEGLWSAECAARQVWEFLHRLGGRQPS